MHLIVGGVGSSLMIGKDTCVTFILIIWNFKSFGSSVLLLMYFVYNLLIYVYIQMKLLVICQLQTIVYNVCYENWFQTCAILNEYVKRGLLISDRDFRKKECYIQYFHKQQFILQDISLISPEV